MTFLMTDTTSQTRQVEQSYKGQLGGARKGSGRKKLPLQEKLARQREGWKRRYGDKIVFQARTDKDGKDKIEMMKKQLGFRSNDKLLEWLLERGERSLARKYSDSVD